MARNPWKTLGTTRIYHNPWFSVSKNEVIRPDGRPGTYSVVNAERLAIGVVPVWNDGSVTLVGQHRYPIDEYSWEIPEGGGDPARDPMESAKRELLEEAGIVAGSWTYLGRCHTSNCFVDEVCHLYLARDLSQGRPEPGGDEEIAVRKVPLSEAVAMADDGRMTDSISIVGLFRAMNHLRRSFSDKPDYFRDMPEEHRRYPGSWKKEPDKRDDGSGEPEGPAAPPADAGEPRPRRKTG